MFRPGASSTRSLFHSIVGFLGALLISGCGAAPETPNNNGSAGSQSDKKPKVAFVTNTVADFWKVAEAGVMQAAKEFDVEVEVHTPAPPDQTAQQKRILEDLIAKGIDGVALSPREPDNQQQLLEELAANTHFITHDSDAPNSGRVCYIGMDNYDAGRMCGDLVKEAMPEGGTLVIFVGNLDQLNAQQRRIGVIDAVMGWERDDSREYPASGEIKAADSKYIVLDTRLDGGDEAKGKAELQDTITKYGTVGCMVGLFGYNPPQILSVVREAEKLGEIKIVAFDEDDETLQGIVDGHIYGTVVQNPYRYGYDSIRVLAGLARGDKSVIPEGEYLNIPARQIRKDNVDEFWAEKKRLISGGDSTGEES